MKIFHVPDSGIRNQSPKKHIGGEILLNLSNIEKRPPKGVFFEDLRDPEIRD